MEEDGGMASWSDVVDGAPDLAKTVQGRFEATGLGLLATLRKDGFPRISGIEPAFALGEVWLGMMDKSLKAFDLRREPRMAVHAATVDKDVKDGDARITGRAIELGEGDPQRAAYLDHLKAEGNWAPDGPFHLFRIDVTEVMLLKPGGDHLVIERWREGDSYRSVKRY
jgi:hypothetical protein